MRGLILSGALLAAVPALAEWDGADYSEDRTLGLDVASVKALRIDAGAGAMTINGATGGGRIDVSAVIKVDGMRGEKAQRLVADNLRLSLVQESDRALLTADFREGMRFTGNAMIDLEISVPEGMGLDIDDGSGAIEIHDTEGSVRIDDGSGSIEISDVAELMIDDGSGSIAITNVSGSVFVNDGSGSILIQQVGGNVSIDDGSGSIDVRNVAGNFVVSDDGSGAVNYANVAGRVSVDQ